MSCLRLKGNIDGPVYRFHELLITTVKGLLIAVCTWTVDFINPFAADPVKALHFAILV